jgi:hypothetical protein
MKLIGMSAANAIRLCFMNLAGTHSPCQSGRLTMQKSACCYSDVSRRS